MRLADRATFASVSGSVLLSLTLTHLTGDRYQDLDPAPDATGRRVVFASDRTAGGEAGAVNLFMLDLESGNIR